MKPIWREVEFDHLPPNTVRGFVGCIIDATTPLVGAYQVVDGRWVVVYKPRDAKPGERPVTEIVAGYEIAKARALEVMERRPLIVLH